MTHPYLFSPEPPGGACSVVFETTAPRAKALGLRTWPGSVDHEARFFARVNRLPEAYRAFAREDGPHSVDDYPGEHETWADALRALSAGGVPTEQTNALNSPHLPNS